MTATPEDHLYYATWLSKLGSHLSSRYERTDNLQDLEAAIYQSERAMKATPEDDPDQVERLSELGNYLSSRYE